MTVLNFPATPALNETYTANGVTYTWNGNYWEANSGSPLDDKYVEIAGDVMTGNLLLPGGGGNTAALQKQEIEDFPVSTFDNDSGYITSADIPPGTVSYWNKVGDTLEPVTDTDNVDIGGGTITLNADGGITAGSIFANVAADGNAALRGYYSSGTQGIRLGYQSTNPAGEMESAFFASDGTKNIRWVNYDGSSEFAGDMAIGTTGSFTPSTPAISLNAADGSAEFAGELKVAVANNWDPALWIGSSSDANPGVYADGGGSLNCVNLNVGDKGATANISLSTDGSATFAGSVQTGDQISIYRKTTDASKYLLAAKSDIGGSEEIKFAVTADGTVTSANSFAIQLEADDDTKYKTTTETYTDTETYEIEVPVPPILGGQVGTADLVDEPETKTITKTREVEKTREVKTYVGPVLDVKETLVKYETSLTQLKAAVAEASNFDELKTAMTLALSNI